MPQRRQDFRAGGGPPRGGGCDGLAFLSTLDIFTLVHWLKGAPGKRKTRPPRSKALTEHLLHARLGAESCIHIVSLGGP